MRLLSRAGCHLCEEARAVVRSVVGVDFEEVDIDATPDLLPRYSEEVPVIFVDGRQISYWSIDAQRLRAALA
ncbi:MAG: glutaredoxin family protein [Mycobacteriales bacterium]